MRLIFIHALSAQSRRTSRPKKCLMQPVLLAGHAAINAARYEEADSRLYRQRLSPFLNSRDA